MFLPRLTPRRRLGTHSLISSEGSTSKQRQMARHLVSQHRHSSGKRSEAPQNHSEILRSLRARDGERPRSPSSGLAKTRNPLQTETFALLHLRLLESRPSDRANAEQAAVQPKLVSLLLWNAAARAGRFCRVDGCPLHRRTRGRMTSSGVLPRSQRPPAQALLHPTRV